MRVLWNGLAFSAGLGCVAAAWFGRAPFWSEARPWPLLLVLVFASFIVGLWWVFRRREQGIRRGGFELGVEWAAVLVAAFSAVVALGVEAQFRLASWRVTNADPAALERVGRHVMTGYRDPAFVRGLIERRAIAGIFVTRRNVGERSVEAIAAEIAGFQAIRARQGLPPLWVATDQEGGGVSRLSPPLTRLPVLAETVRSAMTDAARTKAVDDYAATHGRELASVGVNLNFAPVVDLDHGVRNPGDAFSRIWERAISRDPAIVADVAGRYCDGLARHGVHCTLKDFPGLGRVFEDTHRSAGRLDASVAELEASDWIPFRQVMGRPGNFVMVAHVVLGGFHPSSVVSTSSEVVGGLVRERWHHDGPLITDDMCMGPIYFGWDGIGGAAVRSLGAGVDMLLVSWDGDQVYRVLAALIDADRGGTEFRAKLDASAARLERARGEIVKR